MADQSSLEVRSVRVQNLMTELELCTGFVRHNLVHETKFVDNNLKLAYKMTMEFNY